MTVTVLTLKAAPALRLDLRGVLPSRVAALPLSEVERLPVGFGNRLAPLAEWFTVTRSEARAEASGAAGASADALRLEGDLSRCDRIGWQQDGGSLTVAGPAGDHVGGCMRGGDLHVHGSVGGLTGCEMSGGSLRIDGNAGEFVGGTLPGSMDGMRGGTLLVRGRVGARCGDRMRRGSLLVHGDAGDFLASRMVAGTLAIGGAAGAHVGYGMRRGSVVFAGPVPVIPPTFVPLVGNADVFWQLLARDLARHGGVFASLPGRRVRRHAGDLAAGGKGELILPD